MKNIYQIFLKYKLLLSIISLVNVIFLKLWIFNNAFNINNYYSIIGIDYRITILNLILFFITSIILFYVLKFLNIKNYLILKNFIYFILIILAFNSIRASLTINYFTINSNLKIFTLFFILTFILLILIKFTKNFLENAFNFIGLTFFPFFIIVLFKLLFPIIFLNSYQENNFYTELVNKDQIKNMKSDFPKRKIIWLLFDQYDYNIIKENINQLDNFKSLSEVSDNYVNYSPNTIETIKAIPSLILSKKFDDYEYKIDEGKIMLNLIDKSSNFKKKFNGENSIFEYLNQENYNTYINGWYLPYCDIFKKFVYKCFQSSYANQTTFDYYGFKNFFYFQLYNIIPGANFFINKLKLENFYDITHSGSQFNVAKKNFLKSKKSLIFNLRDSNINFYFLHSNIPHAPYLFDTDRNQLLKFENKNKSNYLSNLILADKFLGNIIYELKKLNIFDESIIILQGDTGLNKNYINLDAEELIGSTPLLIKRINQQKKINISKKINTHELADLLKSVLKNQNIRF